MICEQARQAHCEQGGQHATQVRPDPPPRCEIHLPTVPRLPAACRTCLCGIYSAIRDASIVTLVIGIQRAGRRRAPDGYGLGTRTLCRRMDRRAERMRMNADRVMPATAVITVCQCLTGMADVNRCGSLRSLMSDGQLFWTADANDAAGSDGWARCQSGPKDGRALPVIL